jgi:hypothetical protein
MGTKRLAYIFAAAVSLGALATAQSVLFNFDDAPLHSPLPVTLTVGGITASFTATGQGFSIQTADALSFTPVGFSGYCIYPNSVFLADLLVGFSQPLTDFSILYAPEEYDCDSSATMRVTAYLNGAFVGTATATADPPGTWPTATLSFSSTQAFNSVVVHYDAPPPTGGDWGPIFMADNMYVTPTAAALKADSNCDGVVNTFDIDPFVEALTAPATWLSLYSCDFLGANDINGDGAVNAFDIDPFVVCLTSGGCP